MAIHDGAIACAACGAEAPGRPASEDDVRALVHHDLHVRHPELDEPTPQPTPFESAGELVLGLGDPIGAIADLVGGTEVERDAAGRATWDPLHALLGALILAALVVLAVWFLVS